MGPEVPRVERRLAAIFAADVAGYSRLMHEDEVGTLRTLTAHREIMDGLISEYGGRIANTAGDSVLAEFPSIVDAVECAALVQEKLRASNAIGRAENGLQFRIGVHAGDVMVRGHDLLGDGVNIAARIQALAEPGGVMLSGRAYDEIVGKLDVEFEDWGEQQVKNVTRPVRVYALVGGAPGGTARGPSPSLPDKPSVAVLPFANLSGDADPGYLADGIVEELIAALSRVRSFFVISRNSTFTYKEKAIDPRQVSRELGVRYVVEGSLRQSGNRLRIITQLIDATTCNQIWGERYEGEVSDIFDLQDRVTEAVVGAIEPNITLSEVKRARRKRPDSLSAYDLVMRALPAIWSQDAETTEEGLRLIERAITLDASYALPKALAAWCYAQRLVYLRTKNIAEDRSKATTLAGHAARLEPNDPLVLTCAGAAYSGTGEFPLAQTLIERALTLDPNSAWAWNRSGWLNVYIREPDRAIQHFQRAMRLSPIDPLKFNLFHGIGAAHFGKAEYAEAARWVEKCLREKPDAVWANRLLTAAYYHAGEIEEAKRAFAAFLVHFPEMTISRILELTPFSSQQVHGKFAEAFRNLGLPE